MDLSEKKVVCDRPSEIEAALSARPIVKAPLPRQERAPRVAELLLFAAELNAPANGVEPPKL